MRWAVLLVALAALPTAGAAPGPHPDVAFIINHGGQVGQTLWTHMPNDGSPLAGGNDSCCDGFMSVVEPDGASILVGGPLRADGCVAPPSGLFPLQALHTWVVGVSPDRFPLANQSMNYAHYHWNPANMEFTLGPTAKLIWYAGVDSTGAAAGSPPLPLTVRLRATLVVEQTVAGSDGIHEVVNQWLGSGMKDAVLFASTPATPADSIVVAGHRAYKFQVPLVINQTAVHVAPQSEMRLLLDLLVQDPGCGAGASAFFDVDWAFAATAPEGRSALAISADPALRIDSVDLQANATAGRVRVNIQSPWGESDVEPSFNLQIAGKQVDVAHSFDPPTHRDFHARFDGNQTWSWTGTGPGEGSFSLIASNHATSGQTEADVSFFIPAAGSVSCSLRADTPDHRACETTELPQEAPGLPPLAIAALVAVAAALRRRTSL
jgi:hypothetical protein